MKANKKYLVYKQHSTHSKYQSCPPTCREITTEKALLFLARESEPANVQQLTIINKEHSRNNSISSSKPYKRPRENSNESSNQVQVNAFVIFTLKMIFFPSSSSFSILATYISKRRTAKKN